MPTLKDISRRIRGVEKTQQITSAMRMVAAAKLRRAQDAIIAARPYSQRMYATLGEIGRREKDAEHPLLQARESQKAAEILVVSSDRGLCGAFNNAVLKTSDEAIADCAGRYERVFVSAVGRKAEDYHRRRRSDDITQTWTDNADVTPGQAVEIAEHLAGRYLAGEVDRVIVVGNEYVSAMTQTPRVIPLLPFGVEEEVAEAGEAPVPFEIEPDAKALLDVLVPQALEFTLYRILLENQAGEHAARMAAMESATRNTEELIRTLTLQFNRARQAAITRELVEIVSGAEALD